MPIPQPLTDFMANTLQPLKDADDAAIAAANSDALAVTKAQAQATSSAAAQQQTDTALTAGWQQFLAIAASYYAPGGTLSKPNPQPTDPATSTLAPSVA